MVHRMGSSRWSVSRIFSALGIEYTCQHAYERAEEVVGKAIKIVVKRATKEALGENIKPSKEPGDGTHQTELYGDLLALKMSIDAGWQCWASWQRYDSACGVVHFVGVHCGKVCYSRLDTNRCHICDKIQAYRNKKKGKSKEEGIKRPKVQSKNKAKQISPVHE